MRPCCSCSGMLVSVERTDPTDPLRNIRVLTPGHEARALYGNMPYHPALLSYLRPYGGLRFMDWMHTNAEQLPREWDERPLVTDRWVSGALRACLAVVRHNLRAGLW